MRNIKKILIGIVVLLITLIPLKVSAEEDTIYDGFISNISASTTSYYELQTKPFNSYLKNEYMTVYLVLSEKNESLYLNILYIKETNSAYLRINTNLNYKNYYADRYGIIYGIEVPFESTIKLDVCINGVASIFDTVTLPVYKNIDEYRNLDITITNGTNEFPDNVLSKKSLSTENYLTIIIIAGLVVCLIFGVIIILMLKFKKVNIRRESIYGVVDNNQTHDEYIEADYSFTVEEHKEEVQDTKKVAYTKADLIDLYRKKFNNEITDAEFDYALKKYLSARDDEDDDE